jgi:hypothetical protein
MKKRFSLISQPKVYKQAILLVNSQIQTHQHILNPTLTSLTLLSHLRPTSMSLVVVGFIVQEGRRRYLVGAAGDHLVMDL